MEIFNFSKPKPYTPYAEACPAEDEAENKFNQSKSIDHKALFIRVLYNEGDNPSDRIKCETNFALAVAYNHHKDGKIIDFGYEVSEKQAQTEQVNHREKLGEKL